MFAKVYIKCTTDAVLPLVPSERITFGIHVVFIESCFHCTICLLLEEVDDFIGQVNNENQSVTSRFGTTVSD